MQYVFDIGASRRQPANYAFQGLFLNRYFSRTSGEQPLGNKQLHDARIASGDVHLGCCYVVPTERVYLDPLSLPVDPLRANRRAF